MPFSNSGKTDCLNALRTATTHLSGHTAYPGDSGASEVTGGTYARLPITWAAVAGSPPSFDLSAALDLAIPAGVTVKWIGGFTALTAGTFKTFAPCGSTLRGVATIQATDDIFRSDNHGLPNDRRVVFYAVAGESVPTGLTEGTDYFVINQTADTFQVSLTQGGAVVNFTGDGEVRWQDMVPATDAAAFVCRVSSFVQDLQG